MIKIFVDSSSGIKKEEAAHYGIEIIPLRILIDGVEYLDGENLPIDAFYDALINKKEFPKTSLPSLEDAKNKVDLCTRKGFDVIILTMSSGISGTFDAISNVFKENEKVRVIDTKTSVGGIRILAEEGIKYLNCDLNFVEDKINALIPRIRAIAVPETLNYLHKGGRLNAVTYAVGTALRIKPVVELKERVKVSAKTIGLKLAMKHILSVLDGCDVNYPIIPSYTYDSKNLENLIALTDEKYKKIMTDYDNISPVIAAHWGPNAFGYVFVEKE